MKVLFCRSRTPISWAIRMLTWSPWSHVVIVDPDNEHCYEARFPRVRSATLAQVLKDNHLVKAVDFHLARPDNAVAWAKTQLGHKYDWRALFGFIFHRDWTEPGEWFCSEFVAMAWDKGGSPMFRRKAVNRITPLMVWVLPGKECKL